MEQCMHMDYAVAYTGKQLYFGLVMAGLVQTFVFKFTC